jgi:hypothetical protein
MTNLLHRNGKFVTVHSNFSKLSQRTRDLRVRVAKCFEDDLGFSNIYCELQKKMVKETLSQN